jgi:hypothetical protein
MFVAMLKSLSAGQGVTSAKKMGDAMTRENRAYEVQAGK